MQASQIVYILLVFVLGFYLTTKAQNKWFIGAILFWLFSPPILGDPRYIISLPFAGLDLQPSRILFIFLSATLVFFIIRAKINRESILDFRMHQFRFYEMWMVIFIIISAAIMALNINQLGSRFVIVSLVKLLTFVLVYFFARECVSPQDFRLLAVAIVAFAILSSLVGVFQFLINPSFFRLGVTLIAFGSYFRGNGLFFSEYEQGLFLTIAAIIGLLTFQNKWVRALILTIIPAGVFCTMHRGCWAILLISVGVILMKQIRKLYPWFIAGAIVIVLALFIVLNLPLERNYSGSFLNQLINGRVQDNTLTVRLNLNEFAIYLIQKYPLGIGDYSSMTYIQEAYKNAIDFVNGVSPLIVHNGFLAIGVLYGVAGMIAFALFIATTILHFLQKRFRSTNIGLMAVLIMTSFLFINMTQDLSFMGEQYGLFIGLLIGSAMSLSSYAVSPNRARTITLPGKISGQISA